jgi:hypothetical protein
MPVGPSTELAVTRIQMSGTRTVADFTSNAAGQLGVAAENFTAANHQLERLWVSFGVRHGLAAPLPS